MHAHTYTHPHTTEGCLGRRKEHNNLTHTKVFMTSSSLDLCQALLYWKQCLYCGTPGYLQKTNGKDGLHRKVVRSTLKHTLVTTAYLIHPGGRKGIWGISMPWKKTFQIHPTWKLLSSQNNSGSTAQLLFLLQQNKRFSKLEDQKSLLTYIADTMVGVLLITYWKKETQLVPPDQGPGTWPGTSVSRANQKQSIMTESKYNPVIIT